MDLLREYQREHPEECEGINRLKAYSKSVEDERIRRVQEKQERIEECRRKLYGEKH